MQTLTKESKTERLYRWCMEKKLFNTNHIREWEATQPDFGSARERVREFVQQNKGIRRIDHEESILRGLNKPGAARIRWYEVE